MSLAKDLHNWRRKNRIKQVEAAEMLKVCLRTYQNWEIGHRIPNPLIKGYLEEKIGLKKQTVLARKNKLRH